MFKVMTDGLCYVAGVPDILQAKSHVYAALHAYDVSELPIEIEILREDNGNLVEGYRFGLRETRYE